MDPATFDRHVAWFRDYEAEAALIHDIIRRNASETRTIIELGCGTANLMLALCRIGYDVVGVDKSKDMLRRAARKLERAGYPARLVPGDVADGISSSSEYDVTVGTFSLVFNFFPEARLSRFFQTAAALTRSNGLLVLN
jgi:SAM-dependent methyltransferase